MRRPVIATLLLLAAVIASLGPVRAQPAVPQTSPATRRSPASRPSADLARQRLQALTRQGIALLGAQKPAEAAQVLQEALTLSPTSAINLYNMACAKALLGRSEAAVDYLERSALEGFTDFAHIAADSDLTVLHGMPRFQKFLARKDEFMRISAERVLAFLKRELGTHYLYELDTQHKFIFASDTDKETLESLKGWLTRQAASQWAELFDHKPDYYIVVLLPNPKDYQEMVPMPGVGGLYSPERRTLVCQKMGQVVTHEFTHAMHAADIDPLGQEHPIWLTEGLASMYEAGRFEGDKLIPSDNYRLEYLQSAARRNRLIPLKRLLNMDQPAFVRSPTLAYGESSSLLLYLHETGLLKKFYDTFKKDWEHDKTGLATLEKVTGRSLANLESDWKNWMVTRKSPVLFTGQNGVVMGVRFSEQVGGIQNDGLRIDFVSPAGPAGRAGMKAGDVIVGLGNDDVRDQQSLVPLLATHNAGDQVSIKVRRGQEYLILPVTLARRSELGATTQPARPRRGRPPE